MNLVKRVIGWIAITLAIGSTECSAEQKFEELLVTSDGNFLFYNNPVAQKIDDGSFVVSYLTSNGRIILELWENKKRIKKYVVHDYKYRGLNASDKTDDHAAAAIFFDRKKNRVLVATAYHSSEMYIYEVSLDRGSVDLLSVWPGKYSYPRFVESEGGGVLLARKQPENYIGGDLILRYIQTEFRNEEVVIKSDEGTVIYAGTPTIYDGNLMVSYSTYSKLENRLIGFDIIKYDLKVSQVISRCNLEGLIDKNYLSNRPTGLKAYGGNLFLATSFSLAPVTHKVDQNINFNEKETVILVKGDVLDCSSFKIILRENNVKMPYYDVDVAFNDSGNFLFFNGEKVVTNWFRSNSDCFLRKKMLYPNFVGNDLVFYAVMNGDYSIRNFNNSIYLCSKN